MIQNGTAAPSLGNLFFDPERFFAASAGRTTASLKTPALIVLGATALTLCFALYMQRSLLGILSAAITNQALLPPGKIDQLLSGLKLASSVAGIAAGFGALLTLVRWVLVSVLFANLAVLMDRRYKFREMAYLAGFTFVVYYLALLVELVLMLAMPLRPAAGGITMAHTTAQMQEAMSDQVRTLAATMPLPLIRNLSWAVLAWQYALLATAFRQLYKVTWKQALLCGGAVAVLLEILPFFVSKLF